MTDTPKKTLTLKRSGTGQKPGVDKTVSRSGKRIIRRDDLPRAKPAKAPAKTTAKKKPARVSRPKMTTPPSELRARELYERLNQFPVWRDCLPLAIGIEKAIFKLCNDEQFPGASKKVVQKVLSRHTRRDVYRENLTRGGKRYHLEGQAVGSITENQQVIAEKQLKSRTL